MTLASNGYSVGDCDDRPWGSWRVIAAEPGYVVKEISVNPGARLSLQSHDHRRECWTIVRGAAVVTIDEKQRRLSAGDVADIPVGALHRIENAAETQLTFIEVQSGEILDEDDIKRYEDSYGRV